MAMAAGRFAFSGASSIFWFVENGKMATISPIAEKSARRNGGDCGAGKKCCLNRLAEETASGMSARNKLARMSCRSFRRLAE